jgi:Anti-sigma-K factor rskA/Putative zinc-finger
MMTCQEVRELLAALSLDALDVDELDVVEDHLANCPTCADIHRGYEEMVAALAIALPQVDPPAGLKGRIVAAATVGDRSMRPAWWRFAARRTSPLGLVAALALILAVGTAIWAASLQWQLAEQRALVATYAERARRYENTVAVLQAEAMHTRLLEGTPAAPGAFGRVLFDQTSGAGVMVVWRLPPLPEGRAYQLWLVKPDGQRTSCGLLQRTDDYGNGETLIQAPVPLTDWQGLGVTEEPVTGSPGPTGTRMLAGSLQ